MTWAFLPIYIETKEDLIAPYIECGDKHYVDSGIVYNGAPTFTITAPHLIGETVKILANMVIIDDQVVEDDGIIRLPFAATCVHVGLKYEAKLRPMRPVTSPEMMASIVTVKQMGISVLNTGPIKVGVSDDDMKDVSFADMKNKCEIDGLFTGTVAVSVPDGYSKNCPLQISTDSPLPCTIRAMIVKLDKTGA